jgi:hypothetical protein
MRTPGLRDALYLVSKGVPYGKAMRMSPARRLAYVVIFGELEGGKWDQARGRWEERDA